MALLDIINLIKEKKYFTNSFLSDFDIKNELTEVSSDLHNEFLFANSVTKYNFRYLYFWFNLNYIEKVKIALNDSFKYVIEVVLLKNDILETIIPKFLTSNNFFEYRTFNRMILIKDKNFDFKPSIEICFPKENDLRSIQEILESNFDIYSERIPTIDELRKLSKTTFLIKDTEKICALLISEIKGKTEELRYWLVLSDYRSKGYGTILMNYFLNLNKNTVRYLLWVDNNNSNAIQKYDKFNFKRDRLVNKIYINQNIMKEKVLEILKETRPEFDFNVVNVDFIKNGYLDSFDLVTIVSDLEKVFQIKIKGQFIIPENFKNLDAIVNLIQISNNVS
jgi:acyl carrier protein/GNAT superfamily N-acetyltransferase